MLKPKVKITQKEIKRDPFLESVDKVQAHYQGKRSLYLKITIAFIFLIIGFNFYQNNKTSINIKSSTALGIALISIDNKDVDNAGFQLERLIDDYPNSKNSYLANYYLGKIKFDQGASEEAKKLLITYYDSGFDDLLRPSASLMLSKLYLKDKDYDNALKWLVKVEHLKTNSYLDEAHLMMSFFNDSTVTLP